jgi:hypothetical protein
MVCIKKVRLKLFCLAVTGLIVAVLVATGAVKFWLGPAILREHLIQAISRLWLGHVAVGDIQFDYFGPVRVSTIVFSDSSGNRWLSMRETKLTLANWYKLKPTLTEIETETVGLNLHFVDGKCAAPLWPADKRPTGSKRSRMDLQRLVIQKASVAIVQKEKTNLTYDDLTLIIIRKQNSYEISISQPSARGSEVFAIQGTINPTILEANLSLQMKRQVKKAESAVFSALLSIPESYQAEGGLTADVLISGRLKEPTNLQLKGSVKLDNWVIVEKEDLIADKLSAQVELDGPRLHVKNLTASDSAGQPWLGADVVNLTLSRWPGLRPVLTEIETEQLGLRASFTKAKLVIPLKATANKTAGLKRSYLDIQKIAMRNTSVTVVDDNDLKVHLDNLLIEAVRKEGIYDILVSRKVPEGSSTILIKGTVNPVTLVAQLSVRAEHTVKKSETDALLALLNVPLGFQAEGRSTANMQVAGDIRNLASYTPDGMIVLKDWAISVNNGSLAEQVNILARLANRRIDVESFTGISCNGQINGNSYVEIKSQEPVQFGGRLSGTGVNLAELTNVLATSKRMSAGTASFQYNFTSSGKELKDLQAQGLIFMDDADFRVVPVIPHIFRAVGLRNYDPLRISDATAIFSMNGPTATIKRARLSNPFGAIEAEPNGTINLQTGDMDFYVVAAPLNEIHFVLRRIPIVNLFVNLKDKLSRLHVKGNWLTPPNKLIVKEPLKDIKEGTIDFLRGVVETGGQFTKAMRDTSRAIFANSQKNKPTEKRPSSKNR